MSILESIMQEADVKPISNVNGRSVYTFADAVKVNNKERAEEILEGKVDFGNRVTREGGLCYARTQCHAVAINPDNYFLNRYRKIKKDEKTTIYEVVTDYRAIKEQSTGRVYTNNIVVEIVENSKTGLKYMGKKTISDQEFINSFKSSLSHEALAKIANVILTAQKGQTEPTGDSLDF